MLTRLASPGNDSNRVGCMYFSSVCLQVKMLQVIHQRFQYKFLLRVVKKLVGSQIFLSMRLKTCSDCFDERFPNLIPRLRPVSLNHCCLILISSQVQNYSVVRPFRKSFKALTNTVFASFCANLSSTSSFR